MYSEYSDEQFLVDLYRFSHKPVDKVIKENTSRLVRKPTKTLKEILKGR